MSRRLKHRVRDAALRDIRRMDGKPADPSNRARKPRGDHRCRSCDFPVRHPWQGYLHLALNGCATVRR